MAVDLEYYGVPAADYREQENRTRLTLTAGQTTASAPYSVGYVDVFYNGAKLDPFTEFTATDGANIVLATGALATGDILEVISRAQVQIANVYTQQQVNALLVPYFGVATGTGNAQVIVTTPTFTSFVDGMDIKVRTAGANASTTPTIQCNGLAAKTIVSNNAGSALYGADWVSGSEITLRYNQTLDKLVLIDGQTTSLTAAQFSNNNQNATTGFVQRALGTFQAITVYSSVQTLTQSQAGSLIVFSGSSAFTITLPVITAQGRFTFFNEATVTCTIATSAGNIINAGNSAATLSIPPQSSYDLYWDGANWFVFGGVGAASLSGSNNYQKFPSGYIRQWGFGTLPASGTNVASVTVSFPITFPGGVKSIVCNAVGVANSSAGYSPIMRSTAATTSGFTAGGDLNGAASTFNQTCIFYWQADGN